MHTVLVYAVSMFGAKHNLQKFYNLDALSFTYLERNTKRPYIYLLAGKLSSAVDKSSNVQFRLGIIMFEQLYVT